MTAAYFEDHPTDPEKVILRKPTMMWEGSLHIVCECDKCKAQSEQEPVAWLNEEKKIIYWHNTHETDDYHGFKRTTPLYTTPPQRKPLTDEEIQTIAKEHIAVGTRSFEEFVRRIEAAHGIKGEA